MRLAFTLQISGQFASALSVLDDATRADPASAARYSLHMCVLRVLGGTHSPREATQELTTAALALPTAAEDARSAFLSALALDSDLAPLPLPASDDVYVWLSFALSEVLRDGVEAEQVRAVFARALAQLRSGASRRLVLNACANLPSVVMASTNSSVGIFVGSRLARP